MHTKDIYLVDLNPTIGAEMKKVRPCVIVSNENLGILPLKIVAPLIGHKAHHDKSWLVKIEPNKNNGLSKISTIDTMNIRSVSHDRFIKKIGKISEENYNMLKIAMKNALDLW